ncbi:MAG: hypothetical protein LUH12_01000 [Bacteroides sp.]|nr:hypothetical protein [Bacteroides sp.]
MITYKNIPINTLDDLQRIIKSDNTSSNIPHCIFTEEFLIQQRNGENKLYNLPFLSRDYTLSEMLEAQIYLGALDFLESVKYASFYTNARKLIQGYLKSGYDINSCCLLYKLHQEDFSKNAIQSITAGTRILYNTQTVKYEIESNQPSPGGSVRAHIGNFLDRIYSYNNIGLFTLKSPKSNPDNSAGSSIQYFLPVSMIPDFLLLFTYYDGRNFDNRASEKAPRFDKSHSLSKDSYILTLTKMQELFNNNAFQYSGNRLSTIIHLNSFFLNLKLKRLELYKNFYTGNEFLDHITRNYHFTYTESTGLKQHIMESIFNDTDFIIKGLSSNYLDFMLLFDISIQYLILVTSLAGVPKTFDAFKSSLESAKESTKELLSMPLYPYTKKIPFTIIKEGESKEPSKKEVLLISENIDELLKILNSNNFFKAYFSEKALLFPMQDCVSLFDFEVLKKSMILSPFND